ncbi:hypothetical protein M8J77_021721 [Diaphorina citri]|nr:hypothetical protein M8J77_021721 [Diaphorina citri]
MKAEEEENKRKKKKERKKKEEEEKKKKEKKNEEESNTWNKMHFNCYWEKTSHKMVDNPYPVFFIFFFVFSRVQPGSAFLSASPSALTRCDSPKLKWTRHIPPKGSGRDRLSKGNSGWYTPCLKSPCQAKLFSLFNAPQPDETPIQYYTY